MMKNLRPHRFPPLSQLGASPSGSGQASHAEAFQEGLDRGYREGYEGGFDNAQKEGFAQGRDEGLRAGREEAQRLVAARFESIARPLDALFDELKAAQADYQVALRKEVVDLVAKVARQVIRSELALQPVQLIALVDETLATMPPAREGVEVFLNPEELERISELAPDRVGNWTLIADARLEPGECRVKAGGREADAGCRQRLAACIEQVSKQLLPGTEELGA
jgi:flagellar assembly protein FliH